LAVPTINRRAEVSTDHSGLTFPPDPVATSKLTRNYKSSERGGLRSGAGDTVFDFSRWRSKVASRSNGDGTTTFVTIDPTVVGFEFKSSMADSSAKLVTRDAQHENSYVGQEVKPDGN
jgi:hypothetical protein